MHPTYVDRPVADRRTGPTRPVNAPAHPLLQLGSQAGNHAVSGLLRQRSAPPAALLESAEVAKALRYYRDRPVTYDETMAGVLRRALGLDEQGGLDAELVRAVAHWQERSRRPRLVVDGMAGPRTLARLLIPAPGEAVGAEIDTPLALGEPVPDGPLESVEPIRTPAGLPEGGLNTIPTGAVPEQVPASYEVDGLPAFRYNMPGGPVARGHVLLPSARLVLTLAYTGNVTVTPPEGTPGISTDVDKSGWRVQADQALGGLSTGIRVNGLGTGSPSIGTTVATEHVQGEVRMTPPNTVAFRGAAKVAYRVPTALGTFGVRGEPGFELSVTVLPLTNDGAPAMEPEPVTSLDEWLAAHREALLLAGVVVGVGVGVALAPTTGGASLLPLLLTP